jgi:hypothetical protein
MSQDVCTCQQKTNGYDRRSNTEAYPKRFLNRDRLQEITMIYIGHKRTVEDGRDEAQQESLSKQPE